MISIQRSKSLFLHFDANCFQNCSYNFVILTYLYMCCDYFQANRHIREEMEPSERDISEAGDSNDDDTVCQ